MPTFPTYRGELPECLSPLRLRHYLILAYWVFFRPSALRSYLYESDPNAYRNSQATLQDVRKIWHTRAWRNLWLMIPGAAVVVSIILGSIIIGLAILFALLVLGASLLTSVSWVGILYALLYALPVGCLIAVLTGLMFGVGLGVFRGALGQAASITTSSVMFCVGFGVAMGIANGFAFSAKLIGVGTDLSILVLAIASSWAIGTAFGVGAVGIFSLPLAVAVGCIFGALFSLITSMPQDVFYSSTFSVALILASLLGALRVVPYSVELLWAKRARAGLVHSHPLEWDELSVLPFPFADSHISFLLTADQMLGLHTAGIVARNPFQRWSAQRGLHVFLHSTPTPLQFLHTVLSGSDMDEYILAPLVHREWRDHPDVRRVLLAELAGKWLSTSSGDVGRFAEWLVWRLTGPFRRREQTSLTRFATMLYELLDEETVAAEGFDLKQYRATFLGIQVYAGGPETASSFAALSACLSCASLPDLRSAQRSLDLIAHDPEPIRPAVLAALSRLGDVAAEVATFQASTSRVNKLAAIGRAADSLEELDAFVTQEVLPPEQFLLRRIVRQWRRLITEAGGEVGRAQAAGPVANPYVLNNPVKPPLFQGREDVLQRLEELWSDEGQKPSVVLYGHRRMGKSSILQNLGEGARFGQNTIVVDFNMQRVGFVHSTGELLHGLALALYDALPSPARQTLPEPEDQQFLAHNPYTAFDRFLRQLERVRNGLRFIIAVDEFELIERAIEEEALEPRLLDYWRGLIQTYPWFVMAFAGLHTLQEMTQDYWHPLFGSVTAVPVSFLSPGAARPLITNPAPDFAIDYDQDAIERIIALTHGQPYLVQLIGHGLVTRFNRQTYEEGVERERRFSLADVEAVVGAPEMFRDGLAYFQGVWAQAESDAAPGQPAILSALSRSEDGMTSVELAQATRLSLDEARRGLGILKQHDVVAEQDDRWRFTVELMRRWVAQTHRPS